MDENKTAASPPLTELILSLEQATVMAKQLPATTDPTHLLQIHSFLHQANHQLSSFLSNIQLPPPPPAENSLSSATGAAADENGSEPMEVADDKEENNSKTTIEKVEERMRDCFIKNKRAKRPLSPSSMAVAEEKRLYEDGFVAGVNGFDPHGTKLRALELVYQFHG
ncbi:AP2/ERF transcription factor SNZ [Melia azedarach]|uniref:AP2/ERF transcription factor SNZ n=1 Tax=Melia azedarach TaxID=155640 RepID=A0ACC1YT92_MELAZ|nr:AP2/ERF transcription factor SNZ [Melia azedarach]